MAINAPVVFRRSRLMLAALIGLGATAILSLAVVPIPLLVRAPAVFGVVAVCGLAIQRHALLRSHRSVIAIQLRPGGRCIAEQASGDEIEMAVLPDSVAWPWMLLLRLASNQRRWPIVIVVMPDGVSAADWRRLSIWLRWESSPDVS